MIIILQKRVRSIEKYLSSLQTDEQFHLGLSGLEDFEDVMEEIGFSKPITICQQVLPKVIGKISNFNANGSYKIRRDLPKETLYRDAEIRDWHGDYHSVSIPYKRYPRDPISAPNIELTIKKGADGNPILVSPLLTNKPNSLDSIKHIMNLFLEIFGRCEIWHENLVPALKQKINRLNWEVFPKGNYPWEIVEKRLEKVIGLVSQNKRRVIEQRIQKISSYNPNFIVVGKAGFQGYMVFGFPNKNFYVLESIYTGNATYILGQDWEKISQLTKGEIISQSLHEQRLVHSILWDSQIDALLNVA